MRFRLVDHADLPACLTLFDLHQRCRLSGQVRAQLPRLWREFIAEGRCFPKPFMLWEDLRPQGKAGIEALGLSMFVRDEVFSELMQDPQPYLADRLYRMELEGRRPFLDTRELANANAGDGVNLVMPFYLQREHVVDHPDSVKLRPLTAAGFFFCHAGFRVNNYLGEVFGAPASAYMAAGGLRLTQRFDAPPGMPADSEPHQHAQTRDETLPGTLNTTALWMTHALQPVLSLTPMQQTIVTFALQGDIDRAIAERLGVSMDAIKQAWRGIVDRVAPHMPELRSNGFDAAAPGLPVRGAEKRRVVLEYLRQHMEELRPWPRAPRRDLGRR